MNEQRDQEFSSDIDEVASYWVVRLAASDCTPRDRYTFDCWRREDPAHEAAYQKIKQGNAYLNRFKDEQAFRQRIERARSRTRPSLWRRPHAQRMAALAACVVAAVVIGFNVEWRGTDQRATVATVSAPEYYETRVGERSTVTLSDGSIVTINTDSRIDVLYTLAKREIRLVKGQGFFEVAKDLTRPFTVIAGDKRIVAFGTAFDVRFDAENEIQVTLIEGRVKVEDIVLEANENDTQAIGLPASVGAIELNPGERLIARVNLVSEVIRTDGVEETSWRQGQLIFRQRALAEVVAEMNRYSNQQLVLDDDRRVYALEVSGIFNNGGPPSAFVDALEAMHPLKAERSANNELVLVWHE